MFRKTLRILRTRLTQQRKYSEGKQPQQPSISSLVWWCGYFPSLWKPCDTVRFVSLSGARIHHFKSQHWGWQNEHVLVGPPSMLIQQVFHPLVKNKQPSALFSPTTSNGGTDSSRCTNHFSPPERAWCTHCHYLLKASHQFLCMEQVLLAQVANSL